MFLRLKVMEHASLFDQRIERRSYELMEDGLNGRRSRE